MQPNDFELTISGSAYWIPIIILFAVLILLLSKGGILSNFSGATHKEKWGRILGLLLFLLPFLYEISWVTVKTVIKIDSKKMTVSEYFFAIPFTENYDISKLSNFTIKHNVSSLWRNGRFGNGMQLTSDPTVLYFDYDGDTKSIGEHLTNFNADAIVNAVQKEQK